MKAEPLNDHRRRLMRAALRNAHEIAEQSPLQNKTPVEEKAPAVLPALVADFKLRVAK